MSDQPPSPTGGIVPPYISKRIREARDKARNKLAVTDVIAVGVAVVVFAAVAYLVITYQSER